MAIEESVINDEELLDKLSHARESLLREIRKAIIGQDDVVEQVLLSLFVGGHSIITGVPGLAKTLLVRTVASVLDLSFKRIQFTPDLMPADITGTEIIEEDRATGHRAMQFIRGPLFANIVLADEINRTPPKTQAALLQAMQEREVTAGQSAYSLPNPFFTIATQNPIEQEGTYPLPEAQLDRFMFNVLIDYPSAEEERRIIAMTTATMRAVVTPVAEGSDIEQMHALVREIPAAENVVDYAARLVRGTRPLEGARPTVTQYVRWGAGPRAGQALLLGAKARALLDGRSVAAPEDVTAIALPVLRHRVLLNFQAEADGIGSDEIVTSLLADVRP
jgi:MoxR-like ATPase